MRLPRPTIVTAITGALTLASIAGTAGYLLVRYAQLPPALAVEFEDGFANVFLKKSYAIVLTPVWTQLILAAVFGCIAAVLLWRARGAHAGDRASEDVDRMLHAAEAISLLAFVWITFQAVMAAGLTELWIRYRGGMGPMYGFALYTALVLSILIAVRAKLKIGRPASHLSDDRGVWRMKELYFNPADPALFVPSRGGRGLTVNFGRPQAIALILAILIAGLGAPFLIARALLR